MAKLLGIVSTQNAADIAADVLSRLPGQEYGGAAWLAGGAHLVDDQSTAGLAALPMLLAPLTGQGLMLRLDWQPAPHSLANLDGGLGVMFQGAIANTPALVERLTMLGLPPMDLNPARLAAALLRWHLGSLRQDLLRAMHATAAELDGVHAFAALSSAHPGQLVCAVRHTALFLAQIDGGAMLSDQLAPLQGSADEAVQLQHGDVARLAPGRLDILDTRSMPARRASVKLGSEQHVPDLFQHHMEKEIREQPMILADSLGRHGLAPDLASMLGSEAMRWLPSIDAVVLIGSGSSYNAAQTARYWLESMAGLPTTVEHASEYRFRELAMPGNALVIAISQSGETADTLASLAAAQKHGAAHTLALSNRAHSSLMRLAELGYCTEAGQEIGVTSTKTFTAQLLALYRLALGLARERGRLGAAELASLENDLAQLPQSVQQVLELEPQLAQWTHRLAERPLVLCTARHLLYPIAVEGAQKLQEVAYLHAEGYPGGELKHGPLALVDRDLPVLACLPWNRHAERLLVNLREVRARDGELFILSDAALAPGERFNAIRMPTALRELNPILYAVALQLLAYRAGLHRGTEIDAPRNLAKAIVDE
ncbi:isomerizing glutamine--fructose-6-phosphate transaminase [Chitiniphilus purpureus]|uniref:Glutamine--fructose-6-phosphate aminotransferase [isomerizing] n=1 Tax=Chitiniphilus purpureus TaxID=2981137 RepID=A0ABY6DKN4_9NEIS|nr:isomerizing glutamine--fructose-6-phosphate transaminase [Chitiniphilus sp. CD1]UXY14904.1 isomerizing glutamine--fructose-6-phosphate transaminase [Chitiniphilus sp. CD1]